MGGFWAVVLAAGESKRMGFPKMLLNFNGRTMLEKVIDNIINSDVNNIIVVTGGYKESISELIASLPVKNCYNINYKQGMLSSVQCGFRSLPPDYDAALVFQGDQPFINPMVINMLIDAHLLSGKGIVIPVFEKKRGHPLLITRKYKDEVEKLNASDGLRSLALQFSEDVLELETTQQGILKDFDTYEDYNKEIHKTE